VVAVFSEPWGVRLVDPWRDDLDARRALSCLAMTASSAARTEGWTALTDDADRGRWAAWMTRNELAGLAFAAALPADARLAEMLKVAALGAAAGNLAHFANLDRIERRFALERLPMVVLKGAAVATAAYRAQKMGLDPEVIFSLAFWIFIFGILGARLFYLVQYWDQFPKETFAKTIVSILNFTEGGLVVYGSVIGGLAAGFVFLRRKKLPVLAIADLTAPSMVLGLAIGRIGCLLNGCCHGGVCDEELPAIRFPQGSPPYMQQLHDGELLGMKLRQLPPENKKNLVVVERVEPRSSAEKKGVKPSTNYEFRPAGPKTFHKWQQDSAKYQTAPALELVSEDGFSIIWTMGELPRESLPVHPAQIYASINGFLLFIVLWLLYPLRRRDGAVFATLITAYPIARFLEELIRSDESGQLGTSLTISQWISIAMLLLGIALWIYIHRSGNQLTRTFATS
jgi:phosphatidylglycerol:prolipoprotein diacylglycerol transferase